MKKLIVFLIIFLQVSLVFAQAKTDTLVVAPGEQGLYFYHVVEKGETLYALSRDFGLDPHQLAEANHLTLNSPLKLYQLVKIPLNKKNLIQSGQIASNVQPLFHQVIKGETLYRVGKIYDDVSVALLKQWNHLQNNAIETGQYLIIGWLHESNESLVSNESDQEVISSHPASDENTNAAPAEQTSAVPVSDTSGRDQIAVHNAAASVKETPDGKSFLNEVIASERIRKQQKPMPSGIDQHTKPGGVPPMRGGKTGEIVHTTTKATPVVPRDTVRDKTENMIKAKAGHTKEDKTVKVENVFSKMLDKVTHKPQKKEKITPKKSVVSKKDSTTSITTPQNITKPKRDSVALSDSAQLMLAVKSDFESQYIAQTKNETAVSSKKGAGGWFRSNVKPGSDRYYALCNDMPRGTIIKVINPINHKYVFVKVLDVIPKQKENYNLIIKLSDAAMGDLGTSQSRFWCKIVYPGNE